ncbi:EamA family transporter [Arcanobacterium phocae]|uniref:EamA family transporter n=1 Tax=Arcanobacterium phocae TaxID=131112 RepID=UPI001C0EF876|nr:EamA family transporter [Arcanobacterium phocae]
MGENSTETWAWAPVILLTTAAIQYTGATIAIGLFSSVAVIAVAWGRGFFGSLMLLAWRRPRVSLANAQGRRDFGHSMFYGVSIVSTNVIFYLAIARIPLGTTVALEFLGPVILATLLGTGWRVRAGIVLAATGVFTISWIGVDTSDPQVLHGLILALLAGLCWAVYMYVGRKIAISGNGLDSLAIGMFAGSLVWLPVALPHVGPIFTDGRVLGLIVVVALLSSVTPYAMDAVIMRRISAPTFALLNSLLPATSLLVGLIILRQVPTVGELSGLVLITTAVALVNFQPFGRRKARALVQTANE